MPLPFLQRYHNPKQRKAKFKPRIKLNRSTNIPLISLNFRLKTIHVHYINLFLKFGIPQRVSSLKKILRKKIERDVCM